jgi:hypothetical protein
MAMAERQYERLARMRGGREGSQPWLGFAKEIILSQALRISLPATIGFLVQLIKGTSLRAFVGFTELSRAGTMVSANILALPSNSCRLKSPTVFPR